MDADTWHARKDRHEARVDAWIRPHLDRRGRGLSHPVEDFLFTYYSYRPAALRRWHPGLGVTLVGCGVDAFRAVKGYVVEGGQAFVDPRQVSERRCQVERIRDLLRATQRRPPALRCFGMHEWAMVYEQRTNEVRHSDFPLRLGVNGTAAVVRSHRISCTHYDAFRFFTAAARPLNAVQPRRETIENNEQPGCLHVSMDCYKWAYKLAPLTSAELIADCFELAREVRVTDMRAAPYDLTHLGIDPLLIETAAGKAEYVARQREFAGQAGALRARLLNVCDAVLAGETLR